MGLGERIEARLKALGINQSELARRARVPQTTVNSLIRGNSRWSPHLVKIARELHTSPAYLTGDTDNPDADTVEIDLTFEERTLLEYFRELGPEQRKLVLQLTRHLAECEKPTTVHAPKLEYRPG